MRHSDVRVTLGTYAHLLVDDLRAAADAHRPLPATPAMAGIPTRAAARAVSAPIEPHTARQQGSSTIDAAPISEEDRLSGLERETGIEPATLSLGS